MKLTCLTIFFVVCAMCQSQPCLKIEGKAEKQVFESREKKGFEFYIQNYSNRPVALPEWLYEGTRDDEDSEYYLEIVRRNSSGLYEEVGLGDNDYQFMMGNRKTQLLDPGDTITYYAQMDLLYNLSLKGLYRVKVVVRSRKLMDCGNLIPSMWQEFEVR